MSVLVLKVEHCCVFYFLLTLLIVGIIYVFSSGTLTCNNMNFRKASINGVSYGLGEWMFVMLQGSFISDSVEF